LEKIIEASTHPATSTPAVPPVPTFIRRKVILQDSLTFLVLVLATAALYAVTSFLFGSFEQRRATLARQYAAQGRAALTQHQPEQAITALRTALSYAPDDPASRLLLAEALAQAGHRDEATNYFLSLRDLQPADGFINLQLARLAREKGDVPQAIDYYRDATLGNWQGESLAERRTVQLELADYLLANHDLPAARAELLVAAADQPETTQSDTFFGDKLLAAADPVNAFRFYQKAIELDPRNTEALYKSGRLAYQMGDFPTAARFLSLALRDASQQAAGNNATPSLANLVNLDELRTLAANAQRIQELSLSKDLPPADRITHLRTDAAIARYRLAACTSQLPTATTPPELLALKAQWQALSRASFDDPNTQDALTDLIFSTETETARLCGPPTGDDALLLLLNKSQGIVR
jgi:tetratricopeptide (TPR) repeat protein